MAIREMPLELAETRSEHGKCDDGYLNLTQSGVTPVYVRKG